MSALCFGGGARDSSDAITASEGEAYPDETYNAPMAEKTGMPKCQTHSVNRGVPDKMVTMGSGVDATENRLLTKREPGQFGMQRYRPESPHSRGFILAA